MPRAPAGRAMAHRAHPVKPMPVSSRLPLEGMQMAAGKKRDENRSPTSPERVKLSAEESLKRMQAFDERKEAIVAAVRKRRNSDASS